MSVPLRVLIVEDSPDDSELLVAELRRSGFADLVHERVDTAPAFTAALETKPWDLILCDYTMPRFGGLEALKLVRRLGLDLPFILVSGTMGEEVAVEAMRFGAHDYLMKDRLARLVPAVRRELAEAVVRQARRRAEEELRRAYDALEAKVAERTAELSRANERLREEMAERERVQQERDRMGAELLQAQKIQAIGQLSAGIAHEINSPLSYILSNARCLGEYLDELSALLRPVLAAGSGKPASSPRSGQASDPEAILEDFKIALQESLEGAEKIRRIVRGLREFSHLDEQEIKPVDLNQCVEAALRLCANEIRHKADIVRDLSDLPAVRCYPQQIEQVLVNLIMNAAQAIPERGRIGIGTRREGELAVIRIWDTGGGIPPENLKRLFEPFFTTKPVGQGTGLGLHVAYKIAKSHGGKIDVSSTVGEGSQFSLILPLSGPGGHPA